MARQLTLQLGILCAGGVAQQHVIAALISHGTDAAHTFAQERQIQCNNCLLYTSFAPGLYPNYPEGKTDNTHLRNPGAVAFAGLVAKGLQTLGGPYADVLLGTPEHDKYDGKGYEK